MLGLCIHLLPPVLSIALIKHEPPLLCFNNLTQPKLILVYHNLPINIFSCITWVNGFASKKEEKKTPIKYIVYFDWFSTYQRQVEQVF